MEMMQMQTRFVEIISKIKDGVTISEDETTEIQRLAESLGGKYETQTNHSGETENCMWICDNNFSCNPDNPPPGCNCHKVCW